MRIDGMAGGTGHAAAGGVSEQRLIRAAHEFEGQMLKELLKPLTASDGLTGSDDENGSAGILSGFASEALGQGLSEQGGFGIANGILGQLSRSGNNPAAGAVTGNRHFDTGIRAC